METTEINSISDLSKILQTLGEPEKGHTRFFRGHGDEGWQMLPSIYRETSLIENEDKIIKDALTYCPDDFLPSDTLFEKLVKLGVMDKFHAFFETLRPNGQISCSPLYFLLK